MFPPAPSCGVGGVIAGVPVNGVNGVGANEGAVGKPSCDIEYTIIRAKDVIRQAGFGSRPTSKPACLSAAGPVVSEPASFNGISEQPYVSFAVAHFVTGTYPWTQVSYT
jgi:hypothetical protein